MSLASVREIAAINEIAGPWLSIRSYSQAKDSGGLYPEGPYTFEAEVKVSPDAPLEAEFGSRAAVCTVQAHLTSRIAGALEALEAAGWHLAADWTVTMTARVTSLGPGKPPFQDRVGAVMRFAVDRIRADQRRCRQRRRSGRQRRAGLHSGVRHDHRGHRLQQREFPCRSRTVGDRVGHVRAAAGRVDRVGAVGAGRQPGRHVAGLTVRAERHPDDPDRPAEQE